MFHWLFDGRKLTAEEKQLGTVLFFLQDLHC